MKNSLILAGAAALAFTAPVLAQPGKGGGNGNGKGGGAPAAQAQKGGGGGPQMRGNGGGKQQARGGGPQMRGNGGGKQQAIRGGGGPQREARGGGQQMRGSERREARVERQAQRPQKQQQVKQRGPAREARAERGPARVERGNRNQDRVSNQRFVQERGDRNRIESRVFQRAPRINTDVFNSDRRLAYFASPTFRSTGLVDGCPPGLAAKRNGCLPPGQAKKLVGAALPVALGAALLPIDYRSWYPDTNDYYYRTADGYVYRVDRDRNYVDAYWPIADDWNGAYYVGATYPQDYLGYYNVPVQYQPWYADSNDYYYRYGDGAIYQVDPQGGLIESIVSLLAGGFGIGQPMPAGYDVYNLPYEYRDRYVDGPDSWYRYNDGNIYQVDPTTQIVQAIVETLV